MTEDQVDEIATLAAVDLARLGERVSTEMLDRIIQYLTNARGLYGKAETLFYSLSALGQDSARIYQSLLGHPSASMRAKAWERHLSVSEGWKSPKRWIPGLADRDLQVRSSVLSMVRGRVEKIQENELRILIVHKYAEVRAFAAELFLVTDPGVVDDCYFDLLIDEDSYPAPPPRAIANLRLDGWVHLHARSLNDNDYAIQRAAMDGLLGDSKEGVPTLIKYVQKNPAERISSLAKSELKKWGSIHENMF